MRGQERVVVAFWNTENLYDTIPSPFYDDSDYTPGGANGWNTERYRTKTANLARVLDELDADIVGLAEVENEGVVRDLVTSLETDYNYIHLTSGDSRGIDLALLYKGDRFFPDEAATRLVGSGTGREFLHVEGELIGGLPGAASGGASSGASGGLFDGASSEAFGGLPGEHIHLIVCHMASNLNSDQYRRRNMSALRRVLENLLAQDPAANIIVMGDMNGTPGEKVVRKTLGDLRSPWGFMYAPHYEQHLRGRGSYSYRGRWLLYDWMMVSPSIARPNPENLTHPNPENLPRSNPENHRPTAPASRRLKLDGAGIYAREYLTEPVSPGPASPRKPWRTFYGGDYLGGYSDHFPVWISLSN